MNFSFNMSLREDGARSFRERCDDQNFAVKKIRFDISPLISPIHNKKSLLEERSQQNRERLNNFSKDLDEIIKTRKMKYQSKRNERIYTLKHNTREDNNQQTTLKKFIDGKGDITRSRCSRCSSYGYKNIEKKVVENNNSESKFKNYEKYRLQNQIQITKPKKVEQNKVEQKIKEY